MSFQYKTNKVEKKRVYYEGTDTLHKGYLLCYNWDTTTDMDGTAVAAGGDCNGKYLRVEKPSTANAMCFAGVVAPESDGVIGPGMVTVVEPNGAIVQVYSDADCDPILAALWIQGNSYLAGSSGVVQLGKPLEAVDRSIANGQITVQLGKITLSAADEVILSDQVASDAKVFSDAFVKRVSEHTSIAARATTCGAAIAPLVSDVNYSDIYALASDVQTAMKAISDFLVALSNEYIS
jgi:hypothetical protein